MRADASRIKGGIVAFDRRAGGSPSHQTRIIKR
jgi:hypothetical protein